MLQIEGDFLLFFFCPDFMLLVFQDWQSARAVINTPHKTELKTARAIEVGG